MRLPALAALFAFMPCALAQDVSAPQAETAGSANIMTAVWQVQSSPLSASEPADTSDMVVHYATDWASWRDASGNELLLELDQNSLTRFDPETGTGVRTDLYAEARRRLDIYVALSEAGRRDLISFGSAGTFDRVWLEAAMSVSNQNGAMDVTDTETGFLALWNQQVTFIADYGYSPLSQCERPALEGQIAQTARTWLVHAAPIHPDILTRLARASTFPCAFSFMVYSPDSPAGRREFWKLAAAPDGQLTTRRSDTDSTLIKPAGADQLENAFNAIARAQSGALGPAPSAGDFFEISLAMREAGDFAGALLTAQQETHHFGPCPQASIGSNRLICAQATALALEAQDDPDYQRAARGLQAIQEGDHAIAVELLAYFIDRPGYAGAAARIITANELVAWGRVGLQARPDLDPAALLTEALEMDPFAPDVYWHLGQRYLAAGAPAPAWSLFDYGRNLPGREPTPLLAQSEMLETRMRTLAPHWLPFNDEAG